MNYKSLLSLSILSIVSTQSFANGIEDLPRDSNGLLIPQSRMMSVRDLEKTISEFNKRLDSIDAAKDPEFIKKTEELHNAYSNTLNDINHIKDQHDYFFNSNVQTEFKGANIPTVWNIKENKKEIDSLSSNINNVETSFNEKINNQNNDINVIWDSIDDDEKVLSDVNHRLSSLEAKGNVETVLNTNMDIKNGDACTGTIGTCLHSIIIDNANQNSSIESLKNDILSLHNSGVSNGVVASSDVENKNTKEIENQSLLISKNAINIDEQDKTIQSQSVRISKLNANINNSISISSDNSKKINDINIAIENIKGSSNGSFGLNKQTNVETVELKNKVDYITDNIKTISNDYESSLKILSDNKVGVENLNSEIGVLNDSVKLSENKIDELDIKVDGINSQFKNNKDIINAINENINYIDSNVKSNVTKIIDNKNEIKKTNVKVSSVNNIAHSNENKIKILGVQNNIIESKANQALSTSKKLSGDFKSLSLKTIENGNVITRVNENINSIKVDVNENINSIKVDVNENINSIKGEFNNKYNAIEDEQKTIKSNIELNKKSIGLTKEEISKTRKIADNNTTGIVSNNNQIKEIYSIVGEDGNHGLQADISNNKQGIKELNDKFKEMAKNYNEYKAKTNGAIAGVAAMGQLAQPFGVHQFTSGFAMGSYDGATALAIGVGYRANPYLTMRAAVSANSADHMSPVIAGSINYEW